MKKKLEYLFVFAFIFFLLGTIKVNASSKFELSVNSQEGVQKGETITLIIRGDNISEQEKKIAGIKFDVFYDTDNLEFVSAEKLEAASGTIDLNENYTEEGRIRIGIVSLIGLNKSGELYQVVLRAKETLNTTETEIRLEAKEIVDSENNEISCETKNGTIQFVGNIEQTSQAQETTNQSEFQVNSQEANQITITKEESKNIKDWLKENDIGLNTNTTLTYKVENPEILEIDEEGNIIPKQEGTTNVEITDEEGNTKTIPITVAQEGALSQQEETSKPNQVLIIVGIVVFIILIGGIVFYRKR